MGIEPERISILNRNAVQKGAWVLYWMQQSQRAHDNPALEYAISRANRLDLPVLVAFALTDSYPEANLRHYRFMLEGLAETRRQLAGRHIGMVVRKGDPATAIGPLMDRSALLVCDVGYTRHQRGWRQALAASAPCRAIAVEGDVVVPVATVSPKAEYAARTIRPRIHKHLERFLVPCPRYRPKRASIAIGMESLDLGAIDPILEGLAINRTVPAVTPFFKGGPGEAKKRLRRFIARHLHRYEANRNQPQTDDISHMSPYLHFGQISPVFLALQIANAPAGSPADRAAYLEELIVRRELAANFVHYTPDYDQYHCLPAWAQKTLAEHAADRREIIYDRQTLEAANTHDPYWNAAMAEMRDTGFMHSYMRMYWGKKIIEWSPSPEQAFERALALNNRYFLDGRDPNSYAGVGWVFGLHDRAWFERGIFGKVRYMAASGLERKCDIRAYIEKVAALSRRVGGR
ncbi:MAG: deoxyribodipyrimidine photo-lyase [Deltaproteobacteria bacterium]|nr:deoxyribodipyrimidine photo-lyase [Deltaproteobacteria bacterium]